MSRPWVQAPLGVSRATASKVFWEPIRDGSPRWREWPKGLTTIVALAGIGYLVAAGLVLGSTWIRAHDPLLHLEGETYPAWGTGVLLWLTVLVLALGLTAALHTHPVLTVLSLLLVGAAVLFPAVGGAQLDGGGLVVLSPLACLLGIVGFTIARARRRFAWFEFPVVLVLLAVSVYAPIAASPFGAGTDLRPVYLLMMLSVIALLSVPAMVMAGYAPVEVSVTLSEWLLNRLTVESADSRWRPVVLGLAVTAGLAVAARDVATGLLRADWDYRPEAWGAAVIAVGVALAASALMLRRRPGLPPSGPTAEVWEAYAWPLAIVVVTAVIPIGLFAFLGAIIAVLGGGVEVTRLTQSLANSDRFFGAWTLLACAVAVWWLIRARRRGERAAPVVLVCFVTLTGLGLIRRFSDGRFAVSWSLPTLVAVAVAVCLASVLIAIGRRRAVERQLWIMLLALLLAVLVGRRELIAEPGSLAAGVSGLVVLLVGLVWRVLTDAGITRRGSRWFPVSTRVLLYAANAVLAALILAFLALIRQEDPVIDLEAHAALGVNAVGAPLVLGSILLGLVSTIGLEAPPRRRAPGTLQQPPPDEKTVIREPNTA
ncbi:MAG: hypothetical protein Q4F67_06195 [Propionibacteriaceae bacterium]|nr:hypothetical protein [Propionibacteriaceae bacterium]